jgi:arginine deiminase
MIKVVNEYENLKIVLVHTPGSEINQLTPDNLSRLLFEDMPYLPKAIEEHNQFKKKMKENGTKVIEITKLFNDVIKKSELYKDTIRIFLSEIKQKTAAVLNHVNIFLETINRKEFINYFIQGLTYKEIGLSSDDDFVIDPIPNLMFQRDPMFIVGDSLFISNMSSKARKRETFISKIVTENHEIFSKNKIYDLNNFEGTIEGGDVILFNNMVWIGISERTTKNAVENLSKILQRNQKDLKIIAFQIPPKRAYMHLDTIISIIDTNTFLIDPVAFKKVKIYDVNKNFSEIKQSFVEWVLGLNSRNRVITVGGSNSIISQREQWNDGANVLALDNNKIIVYERNSITNSILKKKNVKIITINSSELSRGRGGPHCMSMPLSRKISKH